MKFTPIGCAADARYGRTTLRSRTQPRWTKHRIASWVAVLAAYGCSSTPMEAAETLADELIIASGTQPQLYSAPFDNSPATAIPGEVLTLPGTGFVPTTRVAYRQTNTPYAASPGVIPSKPNVTAGYLEVLTSTPHAMTVRIPTVVDKKATYGVWAMNSSALSNPLAVNDPRPLWITPEIAYATQAPGWLPRTLKLVGKNLEGAVVRLTGPSTFTILAQGDADPTTSLERHVAVAKLPNSMPVGTYSVSVSRDGITWAPLKSQLGKATQVLTVLPDAPAQASFPVKGVVVPGYACQPDDTEDDTPCVQAAMAMASASSAGGTVDFGPGNWILSGGLPVHGLDANQGLVVPQGVSLRGAGRGAGGTVITRATDWGCGAVFTLSGANQVSGIRFDDDTFYLRNAPRVALFALGPPAHAAPVKPPPPVADVALWDNTFAHAYQAIHAEVPVRHLFVANNEFGAYETGIAFDGNTFVKEFTVDLEDSVISGNTFKPGYNDYTMATNLGASRRLDFSGNASDGTSSEFTKGNGPGFRAAHFWHANTSHEMVLVSQNAATCTGDRGGDGEAIVLDDSQNVHALGTLRNPLSATASTITLPGPLNMSSTSNFYKDHWVQIGSGTGFGQTRRITGYTDPSGASVTVTVTPAWDVIPKTDSLVTVQRQYWQVDILDNTVDIRGCIKTRRQVQQQERGQSRRPSRLAGDIALFGFYALVWWTPYTLFRATCVPPRTRVSGYSIGRYPLGTE